MSPSTYDSQETINSDLSYYAPFIKLIYGDFSKHTAGPLFHWSLSVKMPVATAQVPGVPTFVTFDVVLAFALFFLAMTIIPAAMVKSICRTKTWFSLLISCVVYCISFFLLLGHQSGPEPPLGLCLINASLVYAGLPSIAAAGLILIVELYLRLTSTMSDVDERRVTRMLWCPPVVHAVVFWVVMVYGLSDVTKVERDKTGFYCLVDHPASYLVPAAFVFFFTMNMLCLEGYTVLYLLRERKLSFLDVIRYFGSMAPVPLKLFVRCSLYTLVICGIIILVMTDLSGLSTKHFLAFIPLSIAILFGSHADILRVYMFWRPRPPPVPPKDWRQGLSFVAADRNTLHSV
ncbi:hypothetical protein EV421DRAFT_1910124 [Armillaria borealis]|uniref:Uncharacterized protein n=1 Tax=Armillaria borealis TaxID=47425 RepID=A0AA39IZN3_9AGAR|nr:hypothetical protein EV421DRAFT_1910124 [Armillaria borealis]